MPKFAANLTMLYNELGFLERFDAAAAAGFRGVEFLFPYAFPAAEIGERLARNRLSLVLHNLPAGNWEARRARHRVPSRTASANSRTASAGPSNTRRRSACRS